MQKIEHAIPTGPESKDSRYQSGFQSSFRYAKGVVKGPLWEILIGHEAGNGGHSHLSAVPGTGRRVGLKAVEPVLYATQ